MAFTGSATVSNPTSGVAGQASTREIPSPQAWANCFASANAGAGVALGTRSVKGLVIDGTGNQVVAANGTLSVSGASTLTGNVSAGGTLTVTGAATLNGKVKLGSGTPTVTAAAGAGVGPTIITTGSTDQAMQISLTAGTGPASGSILTVAFGSAFASAPKAVQVVPMNNKAADLTTPLYADATTITTTGFTIKCSTAPTAGDTYLLAVHVF